VLKHIRGSDLVGEGLANRQIGERMLRAEKTIKNYISALLKPRSDLRSRDRTRTITSQIDARAVARRAAGICDRAWFRGPGADPLVRIASSL
jgi:hypothetical protein